MATTNNERNSNDFNQSAKKTGKTLSSAVSKFSKFASSAKQKTKTIELTKRIIQVILKSIAALTASSICIIVMVAIVVLIVLMNFSKSTLFSKPEDIVEIQRNTDEVISEAYELRKIDAIANAVGYLDANYLCGVISDDFDAANNKFATKKDSVNCNVKIEFSPEYSSVINNINAYASSVNSVLSLYDYGEESVSADSSSDFEEELNINEYFALTQEDKNAKMEEIAEKIKETGNEYETQLNEKYVQTLRDRKNSIFLLEPVSSWTKNIEYERDKIVGYEQKNVIDSVYCLKLTTSSVISSSAITVEGTSCPSGYRMTGVASQHLENDYTRPIKESFVTGTIEVPIKYDMTFYKKDELNTLANWIIDSGNYGDDLEYGEIYSELQDNIAVYYNNYFNTYNLNSDNSTGATLMGTDPIFFETGSPGWEGDFNNYVHYYDYRTKAQNNATSIIWNHIHSEIGGTKTQCVTFVIGWIYDAYGEDKGTVGLGNGQNVVHTLVERDGWKLLDTPAPGAIFSTGPRVDNPYGHTGVVLSVHGDNVEILEGNMDHHGGIACRIFSLQDLLTNGYAGSKLIKFAIPN